jgi:hypothetical protein
MFEAQTIVVRKLTDWEDLMRTAMIIALLLLKRFCGFCRGRTNLRQGHIIGMSGGFALQHLPPKSPR